MTEDSQLSQWNTYNEIHSQPQIWREWSADIQTLSTEIRQWIAIRNPREVWFCGAGTSAFIGDTLSGFLGADSSRIYRAISTTDFVSAPYNFPQPDHQVLIVSFGRSGASSETIAMLDILDNHYTQADRLNITCDASSPLATRETIGKGQQRTITLPASTLDKGFAMTSSYSTMLLSALACFDPTPPLEICNIFQQLADQAEPLLNNLPKEFTALLNTPPKRCIFLGSGALKGTARESALKILELTAGQTITQWDSCLGFRHGPKAIVDDGTKIFILVSNHKHTQQYDLDMAKEIAAQYGQDKVVTIGITAPQMQINLAQSNFDPQLAKHDAWCSILYILVAQTLCVYWSSALGHNVDNPFIDQGNLTRVVSGVTIYPY